MQEKDVVSIEYFEDAARIADLVNGFIYKGKESWDGPRTLKDMMNMEGYSENMQEMIVDYPIHLLEVRKYANLEHFHTDLQHVFGFLQRENDEKTLADYVKKHREVFANLEEDAYDMISVLTHTRELQNLKKENEEGGKVDMCKAIDDMVKSGERRGKQQGEQRVSRLVQILAEKGRMQDIIHAASDSEYREKLFVEFGL